MVAPLVPIIGALLRGAGSFGGAMLRGGVAAARAAPARAAATLQNAGQAGRALWTARQASRSPEPPEQYDRARLARRLGVAAPSEEQEAAEKARITRANNTSAKQQQQQSRAMLISSARVGAKFVGIAGAAVVATKAVTSLGQAMNDVRVNQLRVFNASIAALAAKQEAFQMGHMVRYARMVQGTTTSLGEKMMQVKKGAEPYKALTVNLSNTLFSIAADIMLKMQNMADSIGLTALVRRLNQLLGGGNVPMPGQTGIAWLEDAKRGGLVQGKDGELMRPDDHPGARPGAGF